MTRFLTSLVLIPFFLYIVLWSPAMVFVGVVAVLALICFHEFLGLARAHFPALNSFRFGPIPYVAGLVFLLTPPPEWLFLVLAALIVMLLVLRSQDLAACLPLAASAALGFIYIFGCWRSAIALRAISVHWMLFATGITWVGDTFAFYAGHAFGRHKLAPRISPGKSWEGTTASLVAALALGALYLHYFMPKVPLANALGLCFIANIAGQLGDLTESAFKRGAGIKDSGNLLPGHGGWLDRVDSSLFSMPVVYCLISQTWFVTP